jgi:hypothetical protein
VTSFFFSSSFSFFGSFWDFLHKPREESVGNVHGDRSTYMANSFFGGLMKMYFFFLCFRRCNGSVLFLLYIYSRRSTVGLI